MPNSFSVSRKQRIVPAAMPGHASGNTTFVATIQPSAPRLFAASTSRMSSVAYEASVGRTTNGA